MVVFDGPPPEREQLQRMGASLRHRGPDAEGIHLDVAAVPMVGLVHRRLSIIDLSSVADQPLPNEDGSIQAMLNGEIYNFQELRRHLVDRHRFRSRGDTEVLVHGYEEWGDQLISRLDGMFALALWDASRRRLLLARDPFGKKPLYYAHDGRRLVFASEVKALLAAGVPAEMAGENLGEYLAFGYVPTPRTLFRGIHRLEPASLLIADSRGLQASRAYWDLRFPEQGSEAKVQAQAAAERVRELLTDAVRKRLLADVPLGILLSGGVDSSAIAALAVRLKGGSVKTFTVGFEGNASFDERPHAALVARHLGTEHFDAVVRPEAAGLLETLLDHHDEPFGDSSALPTYLVAREARRQVTVALNGDGGDETFAGYERFRAMLAAEALPGFLLAAVREGSRLLPRSGGPHNVLGRLRRFARKAALPRLERILAWSSFFDLESLGRLDGTGSFDAERILGSYRHALEQQPRASMLSRILYLNARTYLLDDLLPKMDRMTMAHSLEARSPLLDRALMEYVAALPDHLKRHGGQGKVVLKKAVADLLPDAILRRPKQGFGVPLGAWFRGELRPLVEDTLLSSPRLARRLRLDVVRALFAEHLTGRADHGHQLWTLLTLELWLRKHRFD
jgi:asparagine synthase (glutamine-hydrolysing)